VIAELAASASFAVDAKSLPVGEGGTRPVALVTAEEQNTLLAVSLENGHVLRRVRLPNDPENVELRPAGGPAVVVSSRAGKVSLLDPRSLAVLKTFGGFRAPHIALVAPAGRWAYVTDDESGKLTVVDLRRKRVERRLFVGIGAHHMAISPDGKRLWVALGERAETVAVLDLSNPTRPRVLGRFTPEVPVHDLAFGPGGRNVWLTAAGSTAVMVVDAHSGTRLFTVTAGAPPQHVAFVGRRAYVTSGYDGTIELVDGRTGHVLRSERVPDGSFNLAISNRFVVTASLLEGTVTKLSRGLKVRATYRVASATRDVALTD
jgi:DNA-binding beta-propeller fold protein YncE